MIIKFDTVPSDVEVYLNNNYIGKTPIDITDVDDGVHSYTLKKSEEEQFHGKLYSYPGKITRVEMDFSNYSKTEKYENILSAQEPVCPGISVDMNVPEEQKCPVPSVNMTIPEEQPTSTEQSIPAEQPPTEGPTIEQPPEEQPTTEQPPAEPPAGAPEQIPPATLDDVLFEIQNTNYVLSNILQDIEKRSEPRTSTIYDNEATILTSVPNDPNDPVSNVYQLERINDIIGHNAQLVFIENHGPGLLFVVTSTNGVDYTKETLILEGQRKHYTNIYALGLRSPTTGLSYRVTERVISLEGGDRFSGSRFKDRRNRKGTIVFIDDMESATLKFKSQIVGAGTIARSTDTAYAGDFSIKMVTGAAINDNNIMKYFHTDSHVQKIGAQIRFASNASFYSVGITIEHDDGAFSHKGNVFVLSNGQFFYIDSNGNNQQLPITVPLVNEITAWNSMKLVIDVASVKFVSTVINGFEIDLSTIPLRNAPLVSSDHVEVFITLTGPLAGAATTAYFDNYIFTEDEIK